MYLAAEMYLGLALAETGGDKAYDKFAPRLRLALDSIDRRLPPDGVITAANAPSPPQEAADGEPEGGAAAAGGASALGNACAACDECAICLQPLRRHERVTTLPCEHTFHLSPCLQRWFRRSRCCPLCREPWREWSPVGRPLVRCELSPVNPNALLACRRLAEAQAARGLFDEACVTCELAERLYNASLVHLGGAPPLSGGRDEERGTSHGGNGPSEPPREASHETAHEASPRGAGGTCSWAAARSISCGPALVRRGREPDALRLCREATACCTKVVVAATCCRIC